MFVDSLGKNSDVLKQKIYLDLMMHLSNISNTFKKWVYAMRADVSEFLHYEINKVILYLISTILNIRLSAVSTYV